MRLKRVVFPAPFGPIIPTISPFSIAVVTFLTAVIPPKALLRFLISKKLIFARDLLSCTPPSFSHQAHEPVWEKDHHQNQNGGIEHDIKPFIFTQNTSHDLRHRRQNRGPDQRAENRSGA